VSNRLQSATSPYLLQHAHNPVDWYPWGGEALARARGEDKPIFLSIGYAACHWCHVMAHESFEDLQIAAQMNAHFVNIKVDREERPDLDSIYMQAVVGLTGAGGWPLSVFLTPEGQPFFGGTYWPPQPRHGLPAFGDVLQRVAEAWRVRREAVLGAGADLTQTLRAPPPVAEPPGARDPRLPAAAAERLFHTYDWQHGGWGGAPKFPQPLAIEFLLRRAQVQQDRLARDLARHALTCLADGGIHDQIGGGFHRYSVDGLWTVPHFEKMLYDNALLARAYLHAWQLTAEPRFRKVLDSTLGFLLRELRHQDGGLFASLDADSEGSEGTFYVWSQDEARQALAGLEARDFALAAFGLTPGGNFEGRTVLRRSADLAAVAHAHGVPTGEAEAILQSAAETLLERRSQRVRPACDDKIVAEWNGLGLIAFAEAARATGNPEYHQAARGLATFLAECLVDGDHVHRTWRDGKTGPSGLLADHAALALGFLAQYQTDFDLRWFDLAERLVDSILRRFGGPGEALFDTPSDHEALILRPRALEDNPTPCGNSLASAALLQLSALTGEPRYRDRAESLLRQIPSAAAQFPTGFAAWISATEYALQPTRQLALLGRLDDPSLHRLAAVAWRRFEPQLVIAAGEGDRPALLQGRTMVDGAAAAYLCADFTCQLPTADPQELTRQIERGAIGV
jgi:uncharacterized protein